MKKSREPNQLIYTGLTTSLNIILDFKRFSSQKQVNSVIAKHPSCPRRLFAALIYCASRSHFFIFRIWERKMRLKVKLFKTEEQIEFIIESNTALIFNYRVCTAIKKLY